jgi:transposase InsO family protein
MAQLLTKRELAIHEGKSTRWVEMHADSFQPVVSDAKARNGRAQRLFCMGPSEPATPEGQENRELTTTVMSSQIVLPATGLLKGNFSDEDRAVAAQRFGIIEALISPEKFPADWAACKQKRTALVAFLAEKHGVKRSTLYAWLKAFNDGGLPALVNRDRSDKGLPRVFNNAALELILNASLPDKRSYGDYSVSEIYRLYEEERIWRAANVGKPLTGEPQQRLVRYLDSEDRLSIDALLPKASYATFHRWCDRIPSCLKVMAKHGGEAFANSQDLISYRDIKSLRPLQFIVLDHRRLDLFAMVEKRGKWELVRPWLTAAIDFRTRKWLSWVIVESPSSDSIASVLKRTFIEHGVPEAVYVDNGVDFVCEYLEGREQRSGKAYRVDDFEEGMRGVLQTLGVRVHHAIVRRARSKIIEPAFINTANYDRTLPWFVGHCPGSRPERLGELVKTHERWLKGEVKETPFRPIDHIAWLYDSLLKSLNEREHSGIGMEKILPTGKGWCCPNEVWENLIESVPRRWVSPDVMQCCFHRRREVTVAHTEARVTFHGRVCHYRLQEDPTRLLAFNGRKIQVAYDPYDLETVALYFEGRFLGLAADAELRKMTEQAFVTDERDRRRMSRDTKAVIRGLHEFAPLPSAEERAIRRDGIAPVRFDPERPIIHVPIPAGITEAAAARAADAAFSFAAADPMIEFVEPTPETDGDEEFQFFSDRGGAN